MKEISRFQQIIADLLDEVSASLLLTDTGLAYTSPDILNLVCAQWRILGISGAALQVQARGPPAEDDPTIAGHLLRVRDSDGRPLSQEQLHSEFSVMFIGGRFPRSCCHAYLHSAVDLLQKSAGWQLACSAVTPVTDCFHVQERTRQGTLLLIRCEALPPSLHNTVQNEQPSCCSMFQHGSDHQERCLQLHICAGHSICILSMTLPLVSTGSLFLSIQR
jgi:hypothetical protein